MAINKSFLLLLITTCSPLLFQIFAAETADLDKEISRIKKELISVSSQRQSVKQESVNDSKDQSSYKKRFETRFNAATAESDSLSELIQIYRQKNDSLSAVIAGLVASQKQNDLLQDNFRLRLIAACDQISTQASKIPPMSAKSITVAAAFLKSELTARNIDNIDGLQRLIQIINNHEDLTGSIQIFQGISPLPDMPGTVYRLRIGCLFEAAVQSGGTRYAVWNGIDSSGKEIWLIKNDPEGASQIVNAINIREGKALPAFARVPLFGVRGE
ncbi:MAG TPA: DUF3450 family protein [Chitinispirillaceae bacterium]|nr:DUF3450 family protein [Chitinispirillaceae bacterium]